MEISINLASRRKINEEMKEYKKKLPKFPDGRLDYSKSPRAPVISCFLEYDGNILLLKRSKKVGFYPGMWGVITGFIDRSDSNVVDTALRELKEELNISEDDIVDFQLGKDYEYKDQDIENKTWVIYPILVKLKRKPLISLDWENEEFAWIKPSDLGMYKTLPGLDKSFLKIKKYI